ncbi:hypothetical protein [Streptomyces sp. enrichment culture]|uniref:hypothetical protein n=1 Tax=Streptomyces sp. enrichment culture TaxID=1795815 RepID=UPI003F570D3B
MAGRSVRRQPPIGHTDDVWAVAFSPDGQILATDSDAFTVRLWCERGLGRQAHLRVHRSAHTSTMEAVRTPARPSIALFVSSCGPAWWQLLLPAEADRAGQPCGVPAAVQSRSADERPTGTSGSAEVEPIEVHHLVSRGHEVCPWKVASRGARRCPCSTAHPRAADGPSSHAAS